MEDKTLNELKEELKNVKTHYNYLNEMVLKREEENAKREADKLKAEQDARKAEVDAALQNVDTLIKKYLEDYNYLRIDKPYHYLSYMFRNRSFWF